MREGWDRFRGEDQDERRYGGSSMRGYDPRSSGYGGGGYGRGSSGSYDRDASRNYFSRDRDEPNAWDRFRGEMREGWDRLRGEHDRDQRFSGYGGYDRDAGRRSMWSERSEPGIWERTKQEAREVWDDLKQSFSGRGPKGYSRSDDRIREDVCDRLAWHPHIDASEIEVTVSSGEVTLAGTVHDRRSKRLAEDIVEDILGVKDVSNHIRVSRPEMHTTSTTSAGLGASGHGTTMGSTTSTGQNAISGQNATRVNATR
jgi:osmotically-inducible protein OsmY